MGFDFLDFGFPKSGTDWKSINGKPYITVSSKGRSNGLSNKINDGADFGVDTTLNATSPSQTGAPYTQTSGIQEAVNYAYTSSIGNQLVIPVRLLSSGFDYPFIISQTILIPNTRIVIEGEGSLYNGSMIQGYVLPLMALANPTQQYQAVIIKNLVFQYLGSSTSGYVIDLLNSGNSNWFRVEDTLIAKNNAGAGAFRMDGCTQSYMNNIITNGVEGTSSWISGSDAANIFNSSIGDNITLEGLTQATFFRDILYGQILYTPTTFATTLIFEGCFFGNPTNYSIGLTIPSTANGIYLTLTLSSCSFASGNSNGNPSEYINVNNTSTNSYIVITTEGITSQNNNGLSIPLANSYTNVILKEYEKLNILGFTLPSVTIPTIPASGTAQQNTNPYPVNVYLYGGTVTVIQITRDGTAYTVFNNASGLALSGQVFKLNPSDSITVTYTSAPTWEWLSD